MHRKVSRGARQYGRACLLTCPADLLARCPAMFSPGAWWRSKLTAAMPPKTRLTLDAPRSLPTSRWDCQMWLPQDAAMIDCLHAKTGSRSGPGCYCPPCHQDAANFGANLFIYHDIVWRSRAGFFFQVLRELIYTPDFFVYTMRVARVYTCVCICLHIYTPSYWVCMCVCVCMFTCTHTDLHVWVYVCAYICMPMGVCIFLY